jgi:hypothetical protein
LAVSDDLSTQAIVRVQTSVRERRFDS